MDNDPKCSNCCFFHFSDPEDSKTVYHSPKHLLIEGLTSVICSTEIQSMYHVGMRKRLSTIINERQ